MDCPRARSERQRASFCLRPGTNLTDAEIVSSHIFEDAPLLPEPASSTPGAAGLRTLLRDRGVRSVTFPDFGRIDAAERYQGAALGKPREKLTRNEEMLAACA